MDLIGHYKTNKAIVVHTHHNTTALASGQIIELLEIDIKHKQMLIDIDGYGRRVMDLDWKENLIRIF